MWRDNCKRWGGRHRGQITETGIGSKVTGNQPKSFKYLGMGDMIIFAS